MITVTLLLIILCFVVDGWCERHNKGLWLMVVVNVAKLVLLVLFLFMVIRAIGYEA